MHRIVAMVRGEPKRVICLTCGSEHNYRAPRNSSKDRGIHIRSREGSEREPRTATSAAARVTQKARTEHERQNTWAQRTLGKAVDAFTRYSMERTFEEGELVMHSK